MRCGTIALVGTLMSASGCAMLGQGERQTFTLDSSPIAASVALSDGTTCSTPCTVKLPRARRFEAAFSAPGYGTEHADMLTDARGDDVLIRVVLQHLLARLDPETPGGTAYVPWPQHPRATVRTCEDGTYALVVDASSLGEDGRPAGCPRG